VKTLTKSDGTIGFWILNQNTDELSNCVKSYADHWNAKTQTIYLSSGKLESALIAYNSLPHVKAKPPTS